MATCMDVLLRVHWGRRQVGGGAPAQKLLVGAIPPLLPVGARLSLTAQAPLTCWHEILREAFSAAEDSWAREAVHRREAYAARRGGVAGFGSDTICHL